MSDLSIRRAQLEDAKHISGLLEELGYPQTTAFVKEKLIAIAKHDLDVVLVAESGGQIIGTAHLHIAEMVHEKGKLGRVMALVVTGKSRWSGVGKKLMATAESMAKDAGCSTMEVTSAIHREPAREFYECLGYREKRRRFVKSLAE